MFSIYHASALLTAFLLIHFTAEEITGCTNKVAKGTITASRYPSFHFLFHVLLFQELDQLKHLNPLMVL